MAILISGIGDEISKPTWACRTQNNGLPQLPLGAELAQVVVEMKVAPAHPFFTVEAT